jgi:large subunit ribosomal protein L9
MKVVFLEEVEGTARTGDVKNVADGFARNFLLPRKLAAPATDHYITIAEAKANKEAKRQERLDDEARDRLLPQVDGKSLKIEVRVGEQGKLFGSVTARDIAEKLHESTRIELEHRQIDLKEPIRELGSHEVGVKLTRNVIATVTVNVEPIGGMPVAEAAGEAAEAEAESAPDEVVAEAETEEPAAEEAVEEAPADEETSEQEPEGDTEQS